MTTSTAMHDRTASNLLRRVLETSVGRRLARWRDYRRAMIQLERLNENDLRDLGINRTDFEAIARGKMVRE